MRRERDILASLAHANIARIYDAGVDMLGRPYLALEYVQGEPIDRYVRSRALTTADRCGCCCRSRKPWHMPTVALSSTAT